MRMHSIKQGICPAATTLPGRHDAAWQPQQAAAATSAVLHVLTCFLMLARLRAKVWLCTIWRSAGISVPATSLHTCMHGTRSKRALCVVRFVRMRRANTLCAAYACAHTRTHTHLYTHTGLPILAGLHACTQTQIEDVHCRTPLTPCLLAGIFTQVCMCAHMYAVCPCAVALSEHGPLCLLSGHGLLSLCHQTRLVST